VDPGIPRALPKISPLPPRSRSRTADPTTAIRRPSARLAIAALAGALVLSPPPSRAAESRFGDSTWVAPEPYPATVDSPTTAGPRVARLDHERPAELILRLPFRAAFLPLRGLAMGLEALVGFAGDRYAPNPSRFGIVKKGFGIRPLFDYSGDTGAAIGVSATSPPFLGKDSRITTQGSWSWNDERRYLFRYTLGKLREPIRFRGEFLYRYRPNRKFYGVGNSSSKDDLSFYLEEVGGVTGTLRVGVDIRRQVRLLGGYSSISSRRGYHGSPATADVFTPAEVPFLGQDSRVISFGLGADAAALDDLDNPSRGVHGAFEVQRIKSVDKTDVHYTYWHTEARAYLPVFARRRVLAFRALHRFELPDHGSAPIPFYRLIGAQNETRFAAYGGARFRDRHLALGRVEYRWELLDPVWVVALAEVGEVAPTARALRFADVHESYGGGLRFAQSDHSSIRFEVAKGSEGVTAGFELAGSF
jgi:hypothetical protein